MPLIAALDPPEKVPQALLVSEAGQDVAGTVVYSAWVVDGSIAEEEAHDLLGLAPVNLGSRRSVQVEIDTPTPPAFVYVLSYNSTDNNGMPVDEGIRWKCEAPERQGECSYVADGNSGVTIYTPLNAGAKLLVLNVAWYIPLSSRKDGDLPSEVSAAWAFAIKGGYGR
jgi:hypothetical protein